MRLTHSTKLALSRSYSPSSRPMVLYSVHQLQNIYLGVRPARLMDTEQKRPDHQQQQRHHNHSPSCSPREFSPRSAHESDSSSSPAPSPARQCVTDAKPVNMKFSTAVTGASSSKPPQAAAPQPTHTSFMISDILHSTSSSKNVRHHSTSTTTLISANHHHHPAAAGPYAASYPVNTAEDSAYSEGRDSPRSVMSDDADCKEREGSVGASDSDVERTGAC